MTQSSLFTAYRESGFGYKLRPGEWTVADMTADYLVTAWPKADDQTRRKWFIPLDNPIYRQAQQQDVALNRTRTNVGFASFSWPLGGLTPGMVDYVLRNPNTFNGLPSRTFTVQTWDRTGVWRTVWATGVVGLIDEVGEAGYRAGLLRLRLDFEVIQDAPAS